MVQHLILRFTLEVHLALHQVHIERTISTASLTTEPLHSHKVPQRFMVVPKPQENGSSFWRVWELLHSTNERNSITLRSLLKEVSNKVVGKAMDAFF